MIGESIIFDAGRPAASKGRLAGQLQQAARWGRGVRGVHLALAHRSGARGPTTRSGRRKRSASGHVRSRESLNPRPSDVMSDLDAASTIYSVQLGTGLVMIDTGCRHACGGRLWLRVFKTTVKCYCKLLIKL